MYEEARRARAREDVEVLNRAVQGGAFEGAFTYEVVAEIAEDLLGRPPSQGVHRLLGTSGLWFFVGLVLALLLVAPGCGGPCSSGGCEAGPEPADAPLRIAMVWATYEGEAPTGTAPPPVTWLASGDCDDGIASDGLCVAGVYEATADRAWVLLDAKIADRWTILVHELLHAHLLRATGDPDGKHLRPEWFGSQRAALGALAQPMLDEQGGIR